MSVGAGRLVLCAPSGAGNEVSKVAPLARTYPIRDAYFGTTPLLHQRAYVLCCRCSALCGNRTRREIGGSDEFGFETGTWVPARLLTMIRGAGPGRYLVITDGAGAVPVVGLDEIGCSSPARMRRRDQLAAAGGFTACCLQFGRRGVSRIGVRSAQAPAAGDSERQGSGGDRGAGGARRGSWPRCRRAGRRGRRSGREMDRESESVRE